VSDRFVTRGFFGRRQQSGDAGPERIPPGQYVTGDFPVLSAGPTPHTPLDAWSFTLDGLVEQPATWSWQQFTALAARDFVVDISCVTKWTKLDTRWHGVAIDTLLESVELKPSAAFAIAYSDGGYTTNLPIPDLLNGRAFVAWEYDGAPLAPEHGGPARLVVPHLYFWKSAKWVRGIRFIDHDQRGFWESFGYHDRGDPWKEQRYQGD
jgi:DMSO/TMAO reductase YedYZ molybdopterin-dependent catalytic subunit